MASVIKRRVMEALAELLQPILAPDIPTGDVFAEDAGTERPACFPSLVIRSTGTWEFWPFEEDEAWHTTDSQTVSVGDLVGSLQLQLGTTTQGARDVLEDRILNAFMAATSQEGYRRGGTIVVQLDNFTVNGVVNVAVVPVAYALTDDMWNEEMVFQRQRFSNLMVRVDLPVLVTQTGRYDIDTLVLAFTNDLTSTSSMPSTVTTLPPFAVSFHLNDATFPTQPLVGHGGIGNPWITGSITVRWPGDSAFHNATTDHIVEVGFGDYELLADPSEVAVSGCAYLYAAVAGQQPWRYFYHVATPGDIVIREVPFLLVSTTDINGDTTGHTFTLGDVQLRFANGSYTDVPLTQIKERGNNMYAVVLTSDQRASNVGLVYIYCTATATTMQFSESFDMIIGGGGPITVTTPAPSAPAVEQVQTDDSGNLTIYIDP